MTQSIPTRRMTRRIVAGLTLIELLVAMSVFSVLGVFLFTLMRGSLAIYRSSQGTAEYYDKFDQTLDVLADDLRCVHRGDPGGDGFKARFLLTHDRKWIPPKKLDATQQARDAKTWSPGDPRSFLLRFVRTIPGGEMSHPIGRFAGSAPNSSAYWDGKDDERESQAEVLTAIRPPSDEGAQRVESLLPPLGLMEVMYFLDQGPFDAPGTFTLYRAYRSPPGGADSFFESAALEAMTPEWIEVHADPVVSGLAFFGLVCWSQNTTNWDTERVLDGASIPAEDGGASTTSELWWDSTRGLSDKFSLRRGSASLANSEDDVFPTRVQLIATYLQEGSAGADALLVGSLQPLARTLFMTSTEKLGRGANDSGSIRIGDEWMGVEGVDGNEVRVKRGIRSTGATAHQPGSPVRIGRTFKSVIEIPSGRSYHRGPGESR